MFRVGPHPRPQHLVGVLIEETRDDLVDRHLAEILRAGAHQPVSGGHADPDRRRRHVASLRGRLLPVCAPIYLYPIWRRLLLLLISVVLPIVVTVVTVITVLDEPAIGSAVGTAIGTAVSTAIAVAVHMAFWATAVFAVLERTGVARASLRRAWTLDDLPRYEPGWLTPSQVAANGVWPVLLIATLVLQQFTFTSKPVLDPDNWSFWWPYLIAVLVLECAYAIWLYRRGAWTHTVTLVNAALALLFNGPLVWLLADHRFFNPEFVNGLDLGTTDPLNWLTTICIVVAVATALYDIVEVAVRAERARRGLPTKVPGTGGHTIGAS